MSSVQLINAKAEDARAKQALGINIHAAKSLQDVLRTNLGPRGTLKMLVSGAGDIRLTKDGNVLLNDMQIQHPTAKLIARTATAQDAISGDGTTSTVLLIGEMLSLALRYLDEGMHPTAIVEGFEIAKNESFKFLDKYVQEMKQKIKLDRETLVSLSRTALRTKLHEELADKLADAIVSAIEIIKIEGKQLDLHMVEIMEMIHRMDTDTRLVKGLVLDHGARHPDMKRDLKNCYILTCNVSLEYEKSEVNSSFKYSTAQEKQKLIEAERRVVDKKVKQIIDLKKQVCQAKEGEEEKNFVVINQKGIDPMSLDMLAKAGITALRRAKRRNMERLTLACGGKALNSFEDMSAEDLGFAEHVYEHTLGEEKYTFVEGVKNPHSCTILIRGPNKFTITQIKDAIRDGLRAVKNALEDDVVIPGAGAFEIALYNHLTNFAKNITGRQQLGVKCFAEALLVIPKTLAQNSGLDPLETTLTLQQEHQQGNIVGLDLFTGDCIDPIQDGIFDNARVKRQFIESSTYTASQLLYVDEILKAGKQTQQLE